MSHEPALVPVATATRRPHTVAASPRTGWVLALTGTVGWLASFQLTVDDWRRLRDPTYQPALQHQPRGELRQRHVQPTRQPARLCQHAARNWAPSPP
ncbi:hypothetical protein ABZ281_28980 [Streptomyces sp. NPDC006265]|uniref:hypothetical protein n=1 Tax=Streptomyces sp. NPDC006265 TaxID=3156740 RepID=UPI0033A92C9B